MSGCFHIPSCLALCDSFNRLIEQRMFPFTSACLLLCKYYSQLCYHCCCNLTTQINTASYSSLMFYTFPRITYLLCPTLLLGKCVRYDLTHFSNETWSVPCSHSQATREGEGYWFGASAVRKEPGLLADFHFVPQG